MRRMREAVGITATHFPAPSTVAGLLESIRLSRRQFGLWLKSDGVLSGETSVDAKGALE